MTAVTTDGATVSLDREGFQTHAAETAGVGGVHGAIGVVQAGFIDVERIRVHHDEFFDPH